MKQVAAAVHFPSFESIEAIKARLAPGTQQQSRGGDQLETQVSHG
jgi:hypothetical protein